MKRPGTGGGSGLGGEKTPEEVRDWIFKIWSQDRGQRKENDPLDSGRTGEIGWLKSVNNVGSGSELVLSMLNPSELTRRIN